MTTQARRQANQQPQVQVLLVEYHPLLREVLELVLRSQMGVDNLECAPSGGAAIRRMEDLEPSMILMDVDLPDMTGLEAARRILRRAPKTRIVLLVDAPEAAYRAAAQASGIVECVEKAGRLGYLQVLLPLLSDATIESADGGE